jgi:hypothetical protein
LLPLNCGKKIMSLEVFRIIVANTLFLHLFVFLRKGQRLSNGDVLRPKRQKL